MQLAAKIRPRDLEEFFARVGKVRDVRMITDPRTRRSKGVAYVEFRDLACVQAALALSGEKLCGIPVVVKPSNAEKNRIAAQAAAAAAAQNSLMANGIAALNGSVVPNHGPMKLYVGSLHFNISEDMLRGIFEPFGRIDNITLMKEGETGRSRGYGQLICVDEETRSSLCTFQVSFNSPMLKMRNVRWKISMDSNWPVDQ